MEEVERATMRHLNMLLCNHARPSLLCLLSFLSRPILPGTLAHPSPSVIPCSPLCLSISLCQLHKTTPLNGYPNPDLLFVSFSLLPSSSIVYPLFGNAIPYASLPTMYPELGSPVKVTKNTETVWGVYLRE